MLRRPIQLILDFDGTLTRKDTLQLVGEAGYRRQDADGKSQTLPPWRDIVDAYMIDYRNHTNTYTPDQSRRITLLDEVKWLDSLEPVEEASAARVIAAGIFDNVTKQDMEQAAAKALSNGDIEMRPGWTELLVILHTHNSGIYSDSSGHSLLQVVSVNWSRWFVWSTLWEAASSCADLATAEQLKHTLSHAEVYANELESIKTEDGASSALVLPPQGQAMTLRTAGDKLRQLQSKSDAARGQQGSVSVYIGDSTTDLECLITADVGICVRDREMGSGQKELAATCERIGIKVKSLSEYQEAQNSAPSSTALEDNVSNRDLVIYCVHDFHEVAQWLTTNLRSSF